MRLHYHDNHVANFVRPSASSVLRSGKATKSPTNSNRQPNPTKRVLRWLEKERPEPSKPEHMRGNVQILKSKAASSVAQPSPAKFLPLISCDRCLGLGHKRKDCTQQIRCKACFNYGHVSSRCLSRKRDKWRYREVSRSEVEPPCPEVFMMQVNRLLNSSTPPPSPHSSVHKKKPQRPHGKLGGRSSPLRPRRLHAGGANAAPHASSRSLHHGLLLSPQ